MKANPTPGIGSATIMAGKSHVTGLVFQTWNDFVFFVGFCGVPDFGALASRVAGAPAVISVICEICG